MTKNEAEDLGVMLSNWMEGELGAWAVTVRGHTPYITIQAEGVAAILKRFYDLETELSQDD